MLRSMQPLIRSSSVSTAPSLARYCGNCPQIPMSGIAYGWVPPRRWQFWHVRLLPAKRLVGSDPVGPLSFPVWEKSPYPYLTSLPNGSSATAAMSGGVQWVRSMLLSSAIERPKPATEAVMHKIAVGLKSHVRFMADSALDSALNRAQRSQRRLPLDAS